MTLHWTDEPDKTKGLTLAQSKAAMLSDTPGNPLVPTITATVVITLLFGVFGVIPALMHSDRARQVGSPTPKYWQAFSFIMIVYLLVLMVIYSR